MGLFKLERFSEKLNKIVQMDDNTPAKKMLLKGAIPVLKPSEIIAGLAYLGYEGNEQALITLNKLPSNIYLKALDDKDFPHEVLGYLLRNIELSKEITTQILKDSRLDDESLILFAMECSQDFAQIIADNQQRLLSSPKVIESLYLNPNTPMSTAMKLIEYAVRENLELEISAYEEMKKSLDLSDPSPEDELEKELQEASLDQQFKLAQKEDVNENEYEYENNDQENKENIPIYLLPVPIKIRLAIMGNRFQRAQLLRDSNKVVAMAAIKSPTITEQEVEEISKSRQVSEDIIRYIARRKDWLKNYKIKVNLVTNPKTPIPTALRLLSQLRTHDLKSLARSHNVPAAVREAAQKRLKKKHK